MQVINLFAGPGAGKSTIGAVLFGMLKIAGYEAEYIPEFVKLMQWANANTALEDELYMFAKQAHRLNVLKRHPLDFVVMDGPLLNTLVYCPADYFEAYPTLVRQVFDSYDNLNFVVKRMDHNRYSKIGRKESKEEALQKCDEMELMLAKHRVNVYAGVPGDRTAPGILFKHITGKEPPRLQDNTEILAEIMNKLQELELSLEDELATLKELAPKEMPALLDIAMGIGGVRESVKYLLEGGDQV